MPGITKIYLIGFMGSGKTTAGKRLADALGFSFGDLDEKIERDQNMAIDRIFSIYGEEFFRRAESEALRNFEPQENIVISVGGGAPCFAGNMEYMNSSGLVIYLELTPVQLRNRLEGKQGTRPLLRGLSGDKLQEFIEKKLSEREPFYRQAAITVNGFDPDIGGLIQKIRSYQMPSEGVS